MLVESNTFTSSPFTTKGTVKTSKESLQEIFEDYLKDIFWAEKHLLKALPTLAKSVYNELLQEQLEGHLETTERHIIRLENCFELFALKPIGKKCFTIVGLVEEAEEVTRKFESGHARDAAIIAAVQKIQHYEIATYGTLRILAMVLGDISCAKLLELSKEEEVETDTKLTELAERINKLAADMEEEEVD